MPHSLKTGFWRSVALVAMAAAVFVLVPLFFLGSGNTPAAGPLASDLVRGNLIQFEDNGAWCWFQDERAVVDVDGGKIVMGSVANVLGAGGHARDGDIDAAIFDLEGRRSRTFILREGSNSRGSGDDHSTPALLVLPGGRYLAVYAGHNNDNLSRYRIYDGGGWSDERQFDWNSMPGGTDFMTTYSNLFYLSAEELVYNIARSDGRSPNIMVSGDLGGTWSYGGQLTGTDADIGYVNGYLKYSSNGIDRIDFIVTEHHPRDFNTSIYHGYVKGGKSYASDGRLVDEDITDKDAPSPDEYTMVFAAGTMVEGAVMTRCWNIDVQAYEDGTIGALFEARADDSEMDHRFFYARYDGLDWNYTYLGGAGPKLYGEEQDYVGLGALHPLDPGAIYLSTPVDPRNDRKLGVHEIFSGATADHGATWTWTPVTQNSTHDNLRPVVPAWKEGNTALLWLRGTYDSMMSFDAAVVGLLEIRSETPGLKSYVDAVAANTRRADGSPLDAAGGAADGRWYMEQGAGNGGSVLAVAGMGSGDAPAIRTRVALPGEGTYDVWVDFWAGAGSGDWRIRAGLAQGEMRLFRQMASEQAEEGEHDGALALSGSGGLRLYHAYIGRVRAGDGGYLDVFVDDDPVQDAGWAAFGGIAAGGARTLYDGISYARVDAAGAEAP